MSHGSLENIDFSNVNPQDLTEDDIREIFYLEEDMWARPEGLGEYVYCDSCTRTYSKKDIYGSLPKDIYKRTVGELEEISNSTALDCPCCSSPLKKFYTPESYIPEIKERYKQKVLLVTMRNQEGTLLGFMDGYVDDFDGIFRREFRDHYHEIGAGKIKTLIEQTLEKEAPDEFFSCSSSGTREEFMHFRYIFELLKYFFASFPNEFLHVMALSELHAGGTYHKIFTELGSRSIGVRRELGDSIIESDSYNSDIYIHPNFGESCNVAFSDEDWRSFIRRIKGHSSL